MPDTEVRVGVADTGGWANSGHMAVYQQHPQATLVDVCDVDIQRAERESKPVVLNLPRQISPNWLNTTILTSSIS